MPKIVIIDIDVFIPESSLVRDTSTVLHDRLKLLQEFEDHGYQIVISGYPPVVGRSLRTLFQSEQHNEDGTEKFSGFPKKMHSFSITSDQMEEELNVIKKRQRAEVLRRFGVKAQDCFYFDGEAEVKAAIAEGFHAYVQPGADPSEGSWVSSSALKKNVPLHFWKNSKTLYTILPPLFIVGSSIAGAALLAYFVFSAPVAVLISFSVLGLMVGGMIGFIVYDIVEDLLSNARYEWARNITMDGMFDSHVAEVARIPDGKVSEPMLRERISQRFAEINAFLFDHTEARSFYSTPTPDSKYSKRDILAELNDILTKLKGIRRKAQKGDGFKRIPANSSEFREQWLRFCKLVGYKDTEPVPPPAEDKSLEGVNPYKILADALKAYSDAKEDKHITPEALQAQEEAPLRMKIRRFMLKLHPDKQSDPKKQETMQAVVGVFDKLFKMTGNKARVDKELSLLGILPKAKGNPR